MPTASSLAWKYFPKSQDAVALQQIKERGAYLWLIVVISVRQSTVAVISGLHCRALVMVSSSIRPTAWLQNSKKRAERSERLMYEYRVTAIISAWLSASSSACHGLLIITVITPLPTKPSATKMPDIEAGERGNYWHVDASAWCCCARCKIHEGVSHAAENDALRDDVAAGRRRLHIKAVCQSVREATIASGVDNAASPPDRQTPLNGIISPSERGWSRKQLEGTQKYINEQQIELPISM